VSDPGGISARIPGERVATWAAASLATVTLVLLALLGRGLWFASDEWNIMTEYPSGHLLVPFNGHLSAVPVALYQVLFHTTGVVDHLPYRLLGLASLGVLALAVVAHTRNRIGAWTAVLALAAILWNSSGSTNLLFPFLLNFSLPIASLVIVWWCLDRSTDRADAAAGAALLVALATSGLGLVAAAAVVVELAVTRSPFRRWALVVAPGLVLWSLWWLTNREDSAVSTDLLRAGRYAARMLLGGTTALAGGWTPGGVVLAGLLGGLVVVTATRWRRGDRAGDGRILGALAAPALFVALTALTRIDTVPAIPPDELRYGWTVGAYLVLASVACWRPTPEDRQRVQGFAVPAWVLGAVVVSVGAVALRADLDRWVDVVEGNTPGVRMNLYASEAVGAERVDPDVVLPLSFVPVTTGRYLAALEQLGSPIDGAASTDFGGRPDQLDVADAVVARSLSPVVEPAPPGGPERRECPNDLALPPGSGVVVEADRSVEVQVRRFGEEPVFEVTVGAPSVLRLPADAPVPSDLVVPYRLAVPPGTRCAPA